MGWVTVPGAMSYPPLTSSGQGPGSAYVTLDAQGEKFAFIGRVKAASPGNKNLSSIWCRFGTLNAASQMRISIQSVATGDNIPDEADNTTYSWTGTLTSNAWQAVTLGTARPVAEGDLIAIVVEFEGWTAGWTCTCYNYTAIAGLSGYGAGSGTAYTVTKITGTYPSVTWSANPEINPPNCLLEFSDGTFGLLAGGTCISSTPGTVNVSNSGSYQRAGNSVKFPFPCKLSALWAGASTWPAGSACVMKIYNTAGTVLFSTLTMDTDQINSYYAMIFPFAAEVELAANTEYYIVLENNSATNITLTSYIFSALAHLTTQPWGTNGTGIRWDGTSWAKAVTNPFTRYCVGVIISALSDGAGGGSGGAFQCRQLSMGVL